MTHTHTHTHTHTYQGIGFTTSLCEAALKEYKTVQAALDAILAGKGEKQLCSTHASTCVCVCVCVCEMYFTRCVHLCSVLLAYDAHKGIPDE